jgi:hypothetical protein
MHMAAPIRHTIKICPDGDFGAGPVVFNHLRRTTEQGSLRSMFNSEAK